MVASWEGGCHLAARHAALIPRCLNPALGQLCSPSPALPAAQPADGAAGRGGGAAARCAPGAKGAGWAIMFATIHCGSRFLVDLQCGGAQGVGAGFLSPCPAAFRPDAPIHCCSSGLPPCLQVRKESDRDRRLNEAIAQLKAQFKDREWGGCIKVSF